MSTIRKSLSDAWDTLYFLRDWRVYLLLIPVVYFYFLDAPLAKSIFTLLAGMATILLAAHLVRQILFPYIDLKDAWGQVIKEPLAAAIGLFSVLFFLCVVLWVVASWVKF